MRCISSLRRDQTGGAGFKFVVTAALVAMPLLYPTRTLALLDRAQSSWEHLWTIEGLSGGT